MSQTSESTWLNLCEKVCVVTGAGGDIGAEIARELAAAGAVVAILDRDDCRARATATQIEQQGGCASAFSCDVTDGDSVSTAAAEIAKRFGNCQVLVNNAAVIHAGALMELDLNRWNQTLSVNLTGYLQCAKSFGRQMIAGGGGSIVHIASLSASIPQPYSGAYSVSKAGAKMLSQLLAVELAEHHIRSNVVSPAMVRTHMSEEIYRNTDVLRERERIVPVGRIGLPHDIAQAVLFLASDRSSYISGQDILVDGGLTQAWLKLIPRPGFEKSHKNS